MASRPYLTYDVTQLQALADSEAISDAVLSEILRELTYRSRPSAKQLKERVEERLRLLRAESAVEVGRSGTTGIAATDDELIHLGIVSPDNVRRVELSPEGQGADESIDSDQFETVFAEEPTPSSVAPDPVEEAFDARLTRLRNRLLDITNRNALIDCRSARKKWVDIVDEVPTWVVEALEEGKKLHFESLPEPVHHTSDGDLFGPEGSPRQQDVSASSLAPIDPLPESAPRRGIRGARKDRWDRLAAAQAAGINPSLDLAAVSDAAAEAHRNNRLQTMLFPDELERDLDRLREKARTVEQELGTNPLHLFAGMIEWTESGPRTAPSDLTPVRQAPLVVLPVQIARRGDAPVGHYTRYVLSRAGEDIATNVSFLEKCRQQFQVEVPAIDASERLEHYFVRIEAVLREYAPQWKLRRQLVLGTASFGRIRMWMDLGSRQLKASALRSRKTVRTLIVPDAGDSMWPQGANDDGVDLFRRITEERVIDDSHFVIDADGTQRRVLGAIAAGHSLVVEGPPGTGKSQTIVNAIAQTVAAGKAVLFVAQKETALSVVFDRLRAAGLEGITLPLFANHATSRQSMAQLLLSRKRDHALLAGSRYTTDLPLDEERRLNEIADALRDPWGPLNLPPFQLFGRAERAVLRCERKLVVDVAAASKLDAASLDSQALLQLLRCAEEAARNESAVRRRAIRPLEHPWCGIRRSVAGSRDQTEVLEAARAWHGALRDVRESSAFLGHFEGERPFSLRQLAAVSVLLSFVGSGANQGVGNVMAMRALRGAESLSAREEIIRGLSRLAHAWRAALPTWWRWRRISPAEHTDGSAALRDAREMLHDPCQWETLERDLRDLVSLGRTLEAARPALTRTWRLVAGDVPLSTRELPTVLEVLRATDPRTEHQSRLLEHCAAHGHPTLLDTARCAELKEWRDRLVALGALHGKLRDRFALDQLPTHRELRQHAEAVRNAPRFAPGLLSSAFRRARQAYIAAGGAKAVPLSAMAQDLEDLGEVCRIIEAHVNQPSKQTLPASTVQRLTHLDHSATLAEWVDVAIQRAEPSRRNFMRRCLRTVLASDDHPTECTWGSSLPSGQMAEAVDTLVALLIGPNANPHLQALVAQCELWESAVTAIADRAQRLTLAQRIVGPCIGDAAAELADIAMVWDSIGAALAEEARSPAATTVAEHLHGGALGPKVRWAEVEASSHKVLEVLRSDVPAAVMDAALHESDGAQVLTELLTHREALANALEAERQARLRFVRASEPRWDLWFRIGKDPSDGAEHIVETQPVTVAVQRFEELAGGEHDMLAWDLFWRSLTPLLDAGLRPVVDLIIAGGLSGPAIPQTVEAVLYRLACEHLLREHLAVRTFDGASYESLRDTFARKDVERMRGRGKRICQKVAAVPVPQGPQAAVKMDLREGRFIEHQGGLRRGHRPIREVTRRAPNAIRAITPCVLSTPEGVAQYLPPESILFDLVIIDEASQMRPEVALGALMRGEQAAIVGDTQQLGPDSLFEVERSASEEESTEDEISDEVVVRPDGETVIESAESILTAAAALWPKDSLGWHYRSQSDQLIAFSNRYYYGNRLVVFPSAGNDDGRGVFSHRIRGIYQGGSNARVNVQEAEAVVELVKAHVRERPEQSLMVVSFNATQRDLILDRLREAERDDEAIRQYREAWEQRETPLVVRNLVNVQGDERDRVIISTTFGPPPDGGPVRQIFGDLGRAEGARRINVLVTRAKFRVDLVTSLDPEDIRPTERSQAGVYRFQDYLRYGRGERWWAESGALLDRDFDSPFEEAVYEALTARGFALEKQVGVSTYRVDLAVRHPEVAGQFLMGIECDGATYHSSREARDRDRLREEHLRRLGWDLHRVWSTDWFRWPERELERMERAIRMRLAAAGVAPTVLQTS